MLIFGFISYYFTEYVHCSGLTALFCFVAVFTNYSGKAVSSETDASINSLLHTANYLCEAVSFLYLGFISVYIVIDGSMLSNAVVTLFLLFGIAVIRWISIGMPAFGLICKDNIRIEIREIILIWFSGLIRGSVSVALSFQFTEENQKLRCIVLLVSLVTSLAVTTLSRDVIEALGFRNFKIAKRDQNKLESELSGTIQGDEIIRVTEDSTDSTVADSRNSVRSEVSNGNNETSFERKLFSNK